MPSAVRTCCEIQEIKGVWYSFRERINERIENPEHGFIYRNLVYNNHGISNQGENDVRTLMYPWQGVGRERSSTASFSAFLNIL